ncbi:MAG TPA: SDR family oxidoreductase [Candidatus Sulfopaludibacter sp.]|jgi:NAD(P)-dependent dehydrogenase (short-subunit alcohol dehydrogenase family)|nr:SDR family oxidoreductase [Candidatus Sulfopaludibacter sp.]
MELAGKVAIVTGSGGLGSGRAEALCLAREGCRVVVADIKDEGGAETVRRIQAAGGIAQFAHCDVQSRDQVRALVSYAERQFGGLNILVNNASAPFRPGAPMEQWHQPLQVDLVGAMYGVEFGVAAMRRRGGGAIVNVSSTSALGYGPHASASTAYDIAKAGVLRLTTGLAVLAQEAGIRVNCLVPDWVAHPDVQAYYDALTPEQRAHPRVPPRLTELAEIAQAVVRLVTDESLAGRVLVMWSGREPRLISVEDRGYEELEPLEASGADSGFEMR